MGKQSTIAKTGEIIRQLGITDMSIDDDNVDERDKELRDRRRKEKKKRIANLYDHLFNLFIIFLLFSLKKKLAIHIKWRYNYYVHRKRYYLDLFSSKLTAVGSVLLPI